MPSVFAIEPNEGLMCEGTSVVLIGDNFVNGMQVVFGSQLVSTKANVFGNVRLCK